MLVSRVTLGATPVFSEPRVVFSGRHAAAPFEPLWDVSPDGKSFAMVRAASGSGRLVHVLKVNWIAAWRRGGQAGSNRSRRRGDQAVLTG